MRCRRQVELAHERRRFTREGQRPREAGRRQRLRHDEQVSPPGGRAATGDDGRRGEAGAGPLRAEDVGPRRSCRRLVRSRLGAVRARRHSPAPPNDRQCPIQPCRRRSSPPPIAVVSVDQDRRDRDQVARHMKAASSPESTDTIGDVLLAPLRLLGSPPERPCTQGSEPRLAPLRGSAHSTGRGDGNRTFRGRGVRMGYEFEIHPQGHRTGSSEERPRMTGNANA